MAGIKIPFLADVRDFLRGTKSVSDGLDDVADSLDDVARDARKTGDKVGDELKDGAKEAERAVDKMERKFRDALDTVRRDSKRAGDDLGDNVTRGARDAERGMDNLKDEAADTARETAASFDGSADSIVDMFQETAANAFAGFGPAGAAAGIAVAAGAGYFLTEWQKKTEEAKELVEGMYEDMLTSGQKFVSQQFINDQITEIVKNDDLVRTYSEAARTIGVDVSTAIAAAAGEQEAMNRVLAAASQWQAEYGAEAGSTNAAVNGLVGAIERQGTALDSAASKASIARGAMKATDEATRDYTSALAEVDGALADATTAINENNEAYGSAEAATVANRGALSDLAEALVGVQAAGTAAGKTTGEITALQRQQAAQFIATAAAAGIGADEALNLAAELGLIPKDVATDIRTRGVDTFLTDTANARRAVENVPGTKQVTVTMKANGAGLQQDIDYIVGSLRKPTIGVNVIGGRVVV